MEVIIVILLIVAIALLAVEVFVVPGFGISGILSGICLVVADVMIYQEWGSWLALGALVIFVLLAFLMARWVARSKTLEKISLHSSIDSTNASVAQLSVSVGEEGVALTRLALIGNAQFGDKVVEVKSTGNFIEEGSPLVVVRVNEALILVEAKK